MVVVFPAAIVIAAFPRGSEPPADSRETLRRTVVWQPPECAAQTTSDLTDPALTLGDPTSLRLHRTFCASGTEAERAKLESPE